jgi:hypothetical protein
MVVRATRAWSPHLCIVAVLVVVSACTTHIDATAATQPTPTTASTDPPADTTAPTTPTTAPTTTTTTTATTTSRTTATTATTATSRTTIALTTTTWPDDTGSIYDVRRPSDIEPPPLPASWATEVIGTSSQDREITAFVRRVGEPRRRVLVIGGLHGNEPVSPPTVRSLVGASHPDDVEVWLVPEANPDGVRAGTRWNGNGVDLNRNFSWTWRADDGGPGPISEPETQALTALVERLRPDLVVWVHQPYGYASSIGDTDQALERAWAAASGVAVRSGVTQHGGGESWTNLVAGSPSMLIEIDSWLATPEIVAAHRAGYEATVAALG